MRHVLFLVLILLLLDTGAQAFSYATGGCADGCAQGEQWLFTNGNEIDDALDDLQDADTTHTSDIATLNTALAGYLPLAGGTMTGALYFQSGVDLVIQAGAVLSPETGGDVVATQMSSTKQIDNNDLADGAVDLDGVEVEGTLPTTKGGTGATALTNLITLATHTTGNFVATIADSGASEVLVSNSGSENAAITLAIASAITRDTELAAISAASSTIGCVPKFSDTVGDVVDTGVCVDSSNNVTTPGAASFGGSTGASTFIMRNVADSGWVECGVSGTTMTCATDADGTPDGTL